MHKIQTIATVECRSASRAPAPRQNGWTDRDPACARDTWEAAVLDVVGAPILPQRFDATVARILHLSTCCRFTAPRRRTGVSRRRPVTARRRCVSAGRLCAQAAGSRRRHRQPALRSHIQAHSAVSPRRRERSNSASYLSQRWTWVHFSSPNPTHDANTRTQLNPPILHLRDMQTPVL